MNGNSLQGAGGIGRAVAEWMTHGEATQELLSFDVQRFLDLHNNRQYLQQRIREVVGRLVYYVSNSGLKRVFEFRTTRIPAKFDLFSSLNSGPDKKSINHAKKKKKK